MARKIRQLIKDLTEASFYEIQGGGKGLHRRFISGKPGDDAKPYQEKQVQRTLEEVQK